MSRSHGERSRGCGCGAGGRGRLAQEINHHREERHTVLGGQLALGILAGAAGEVAEGRAQQVADHEARANRQGARHVAAVQAALRRARLVAAEHGARDEAAGLGLRVLHGPATEVAQRAA